MVEYNSKYRWGERFRHNYFVLERGIDYDVGDASMVQQVRNAAYLRGIKISVKESTKGIIVQVTERKQKDANNP